MTDFSEFYDEKVREWWERLPQPTQDQIHKSAVDDHMDDNIAKMFIDSSYPVQLPTLSGWEGNMSWSWPDELRKSVLAAAEHKA